MIDPELEKAIEEVGRDRLFAAVQAQGWAPGMPLPKWVWWYAVNELRNKTEPEHAK